MLDSHRLSKIVYIDSKGASHSLSGEFTKKNGLFCDAAGYVNGPKIRRLYMMAGLISPPDDNAETLLQSIKSNTMLLNEFYLLHYGASVPRQVAAKPVLPSKVTTKKTSGVPKKLNK
jgi:hypothetical protein